MNNFFYENDIRPFDYKEGMKNALQEDLQWLEQQKNNFSPVNCPACSSKDYSIAFQKYNFQFVTCDYCETVFMNPRATPKLLNQFYSYSKLYQYWNEFVFPASKDIRKKQIFEPRFKRIIEICEKFEVPTNCLVDVGAGYGTFSDVAKNSNIFNHVIAIEPNKYLAETCRSLGIKTIEKTIENIDSFPIKPNIITSFEVIEHLFSPKDFLKSCYNLLSPGSIIAVSCPNFKGFDIMTLGVHSESIDAEHINLFNQKSVQILLETCGFTVLECFTPGELDAEIVRNKIISGEYNINGQHFLKKILIEDWSKLGAKFQEFLKRNNLSSHMWSVAKKDK